MKNRKAEIMARCEERLFFPGFFGQLKRLFGRNGMEKFLAFHFLLSFPSLEGGIKFESFFPGLEEEHLDMVRWFVRKGIATQRKGFLRLRDNEGVRERGRFVTEAMRTFRANMRRECPELWEMLMSMMSTRSSPRLTTEGLPPRKLARLLAVGGSKGYRQRRG